MQGNPRALADDGTFLYLTNYGQPNSIYRVNRTTGQLVEVIAHDYGDIGALAYDCSDGTFWASDYNLPPTAIVYHFDADWQFIESFEAPEVDVTFGGIDGLTVVGNQLYVGGDLETMVHRYSKAGVHLGIGVIYDPYRKSGLAYDGTDLWGAFTDWGFISKYPPQGPPWWGFYTGYYWNYKDQFPGNPATGHVEDLEFACGDPTRLWAHAIRYDTGQSIVLRYDVNTNGQRAGSDCDIWLPHRLPVPHACGSTDPAALRPELGPPRAPAGDLGADRVTGAPSVANSSMDPCLIVCPGGDLAFHVVVRDDANNPVQGSFVSLEFGACATFQVCANQSPSLIVNVAERTISTMTDVLGRASFPVRMGGTCPGPTVRVTAAGVPLANLPMVSPDQNGDLTVNPPDLAMLLNAYATHDPSGDLDCDGVPGSCPSITGFEEPPLSGSFNLLRVWPNPFRGQGPVTFDFELPMAGRLQVELYDILGRRLLTQEVQPVRAGRQRLAWRIPKITPPGVYSLRVSDLLGGEARRRFIVLGP